MNRTIACLSVLLLGLLLSPAPAAEGLPNPFYAMDTAFQRPGLTPGEQLDLVKKLGFAGVAWHETSPAQVKADLAEIEKRGLKMFTIYCGATVTPQGDLTYSPQLPALMEALAGHGTLVWLHIGGQGPAFDALSGQEPAVRKLRALAEQAKTRGLRVAIYPHVGEWTARFGDATKLAKRVNHPDFGVAFTLCHSLAMGDEARIPAMLQEAAPVLLSVTINGADKDVGTPQWGRLIQTLDKGTFDVGSVLGKLREIGYTGPIGFQGYGIQGDARSILAPTMKAWRRLSRAAAQQSPAAAAERRAGGKVRVLLVGGRGHDWKGFHAAIAPVLEKTGDFELTLTENLDDLRAESLSKYQVVLFFGSGGDFTNPAQEQGLDKFVTNGGGLAGVHATDAFKQSDVYWRLLGGRFTTHGGGSFMLRIEDKKHPVTATLGDFEIQDETYQNAYHPKFKLHSLARMDRGNEQQSMAWVQDYGQGRAFNTTLGHDGAAWKNPEFQRLVVRGLYWAAGKEPK